MGYSLRHACTIILVAMTAFASLMLPFEFSVANDGDGLNERRFQEFRDKVQHAIEAQDRIPPDTKMESSSPKVRDYPEPCATLCLRSPKGCFDTTEAPANTHPVVSGTACMMVSPPCAERCTAGIQASKDQLTVNGSNYGLSKQTILTTILELAKVAGGDIYLEIGDAGHREYVKIEMDSRKKFFTDKGWKAYQQYVQITKQPLQRDWLHELFLKNETEEFSVSADGSIEFEADCSGRNEDYDVIDVGRPYHIHVSFIVIPSTKSFTISEWKVQQIISHDEAESFAYWRKRASHEDREAFMHMGDMYKDGIGVSQDWVEAYFWYGLAVSQDSPGLTVPGDSDEISKHLTSDEIKLIKKRIEEWKPTSSAPQ